ncbi:MAG: hypothetical protein JSW53_05230 [Candidatus Bathyarchaeota archaeon]|nr:MAG: hypothetical protein JSW53_05230 [Candidatus Bathyarchaeota archaeon]
MRINGTICEDDYLHNLLNAVKNNRRRIVIKALSEHPQSTKALQEYLKRNGYYHSRRTIAGTYIEPLVDVGLIKKDSTKYGLTLYGRKFWELLGRFDGQFSLPSHSNCYEEILLRKLKNGPKTYADLGGSVPPNSLSRTIQRLTEEGLIIRSESSSYIFYFRTKKVPKVKSSPTEKRVYEAIPETGTSARELSEKAGINLRRTYKYLRRLRKRRLVFTRKRSGTYELTPYGKEITDFLEETMSLIFDASRASTLLLEAPTENVDEPSLQC